MTRATFLAVSIAIALGAAAEAQQPRNRPRSPAGSSATEIGGDVYDPVLGYSGGKWIEITYGRPIRRGRDIFGPDDFVEFLNDGGPVWRAGANVSTRLINEMPLEINGTRVPPGEYTVFIELARAKWTLIISTYRASTNANKPEPGTTFGAFEYTPDRDLLRAPMTLEKLPHSYDQLHWEFIDVTQKGGRLALIWENQMASVPFATSK
jgi:hypothetical protein